MKEGWLRVIVPVLFFVLKGPVSGLLAWKCVGEHSRRQAGTSILIVIKEHEKNKLLQIKRRFSRIDLFLKKECAGGT